MADHLQQQILEAYQATLVAAGTQAAGRVYLDRFDPVPDSQGSALLIEAGPEDIETRTIHSAALQQRRFQFDVKALVMQSTGTATAARNLAKEVEAALFASDASQSAGGKVNNLLLQGITPTSDPNAAVALYEIAMRFEASYFTRAGTPDVNA
jgi:hypothetical protein